VGAEVLDEVVKKARRAATCSLIRAKATTVPAMAEAHEIGGLVLWDRSAAWRDALHSAGSFPGFGALAPFHPEREGAFRVSWDVPPIAGLEGDAAGVPRVAPQLHPLHEEAAYGRQFRPLSDRGSSTVPLPHPSVETSMGCAAQQETLSDTNCAPVASPIPRTQAVVAWTATTRVGSCWSCAICDRLYSLSRKRIRGGQIEHNSTALIEL